MTDIYTPAFFAEHHETTALSASVVAPIVKELLEPESVLDIGCGQGEWLEAFGMRGLRSAWTSLLPSAKGSSATT